MINIDELNALMKMLEEPSLQVPPIAFLVDYQSDLVICMNNQNPESLIFEFPSGESFVFSGDSMLSLAKAKNFANYLNKNFYVLH